MRGPNWTLADLLTLEDLLSEGHSDEYIGRHLGRTAVAVQVIRKRRRIPSVTASTINARKVCALLGVHDKAASRWAQRGLLRGRHGSARGRNRQWVFDEEAVLDFLRDPRTWPGWKPERIAEAGLREWATEIRRERYLSVGEVARRYHVTASAVGQWLDRGLLPCVRYGNRWVPESALAQFVPPCEHPAPIVGRRRFTAAEDAHLRTRRAEGAGWTGIGRELGRTPGVIHARAQRLGLAS